MTMCSSFVNEGIYPEESSSTFRMSFIPPVTALLFMKDHSARVPGKNLRHLCGQPLCHWIISALGKSQHISQIIINTDSARIAEECEGRAKVHIHKRPRHLLGDRVGANPLIEWDVQHSEAQFYIQSHSTNPLLTTRTIDESLAAFFAQDTHDSLFSVTSIRKRFYRPDGSPVNHDPSNLLMTQDLPPLLEENSCIYLFSRDSFMRTGSRLGSRPLLFPIEPLEAIDIDEESDFVLADALMRARIT